MVDLELHKLPGDMIRVNSEWLVASWNFNRFWGIVLKVTDPETGKTYISERPEFYEFDEDSFSEYPIPFSVDQKGAQNLFDALWVEGLRPSEVVLDSMKSVKKELELIGRELRLYKEKYGELDNG